jgi:hypothetical protein
MFAKTVTRKSPTRSQTEPEHRLIYQRLNLKEIALPRKITAVK